MDAWDNRKIQQLREWRKEYAVFNPLEIEIMSATSTMETYGLFDVTTAEFLEAAAVWGLDVTDTSKWNDCEIEYFNWLLKRKTQSDSMW